MTNATHATATLSSTHNAFFQYLADQGTKASTMKSYRRDWDVIEGYFGPGKKLEDILPVHVAAFAKSDDLNMKMDGTGKAWRTVDKTARVFRMFLDYCVKSGRLLKSPVPKGTRLGRKTLAQEAAKLAKREALEHEKATKRQARKNAKTVRKAAKSAKVIFRAAKKAHEAATKITSLNT